MGALEKWVPYLGDDRSGSPKHDVGATKGAGFAMDFDFPRRPEDTLAMALIETEEAARRLARAIASDLSLYNEEKIVDGIKSDKLFDVLADEIEEGRALFKSRVAPPLYAKNYYDRAIIDILVRSKGHVASPMW